MPHAASLSMRVATTRASATGQRRRRPERMTIGLSQVELACVCRQAAEKMVCRESGNFFRCVSCLKVVHGGNGEVRVSPEGEK